MASVHPVSTATSDSAANDLAANDSAASDSEVGSIGQRVQAALAASPLMALRLLVAKQIDDQILISGRVSSFYQKQQAQELVRAQVPGLIVVNEVEVG